MTIEIIAIPGLAFLAATMVAKLFELRNDVLYGGYIEGRKHAFAGLRNEFAQIAPPVGFRQGVTRLGWKVGALGFFASAIFR